MNDCASIPSSATILSVEDDLAVAEQLKRVLCAEGFRPAWCATLGMARSFLQEATPDLILLDVSLPDGSGFELCREVKRRSTVPVIFLTGHTAEVDRVLGLEIGAEDYVTKPFSMRELLARIRIVLRWTRGRNRVIGNRIPLTPFRIDPQRRTITYFDRPLELSRYEFQILATLISHPGWVYSREKLMELVWNDPDSSNLRSVDAHIKLLRAKLREVSSDIDPIHTVYGVGYSLNDDWVFPDGSERPKR